MKTITLPIFLWRSLKPQWPLFVVLCLGMIGWSIQESIYPYFFKLIVDKLNVMQDKSQTLMLLAPILVAWAIALITIDLGFRVYDFLSAKVYPRFQARIRDIMLEYAMHHSYQYFSDNFAGTIASKITRMADALQSVIIIIITVFLPVTLAFFFTAFILWQAKPFFGIMIFTWFLVHTIIAYFFTRNCAKYSTAHSEAVTTLSGKIVDALSNILSIRLFSHHPFEMRYLNHFQNDEIKKNQSLSTFNAWMKMVLSLVGLSFFFTMLIGTLVAWSKDWITIGEVTLIISGMSINGLAWYMSMHFIKIFEDVGTCRESLILLQKSHDIQDIPGAVPIQIKQGAITFEAVNFHYTPTRNIFKDKTVYIPAGQKVGLVGFSGSGKTTFVNLILRHFDVESGRILIDEQDIKKVTQTSLRSQIALIPQDTSLFHRSILENIRYGKLDATDQQVIEASKKAHCHEFILQMTEGYNTLVGERGVKLSGGQRQRIAIARAILKNAPILILDEATSSLDSITERYIQESLQALMSDRTTIVIAHRLSTLANMDRIMVFKEGQIVEEGSHKALLAQNGHYALLWNMQAGGFLPERYETIA